MVVVLSRFDGVAGGVVGVVVNGDDIRIVGVDSMDVVGAVVDVDVDVGNGCCVVVVGDRCCWWCCCRCCCIWCCHAAIVLVGMITLRLVLVLVVL